VFIIALYRPDVAARFNNLTRTHYPVPDIA